MIVYILQLEILGSERFNDLKPHSYQELQSQDLNLSIALISKLVCSTASLWMSSEDIRDLYSIEPLGASA